MKKNRGFTLIELMMTIAILAILAAIAVPAYNSQVEKSRRADAITGLLQTAQQMERCFTRTNTYAGCGSFPTDSPDGFYQITRDSSTAATTYTLTATAQGAQAGEPCSPFTINHLGEKGAKSTTDRCWGSD